MVYICPGGNCTGIAIFFFDKVSHLKHPNAYFVDHADHATHPMQSLERWTENTMQERYIY